MVEGIHRGSHVAYEREVDGRILTTTVLRGKNHVAKGTLRVNLRDLSIGIHDLRAALR